MSKSFNIFNFEGFFLYEKLIVPFEGRLIISCAIIFNYLPNIFHFVINMMENKKFQEELKTLNCKSTKSNVSINRSPRLDEANFNRFSSTAVTIHVQQAVFRRRISCFCQILTIFAIFCRPSRRRRSPKPKVDNFCQF